MVFILNIQDFFIKQESFYQSLQKKAKNLWEFQYSLKRLKKTL
jgi:hypothetical protein